MLHGTIEFQLVSLYFAPEPCARKIASNRSSSRKRQERHAISSYVTRQGISSLISLSLFTCTALGGEDPGRRSHEINGRDSHPSFLVQLPNAVWTGDTRDTRPEADTSVMDGRMTLLIRYSSTKQEQ